MIFTPLGVIWVQIHQLKRENIFFVRPSQKIQVFRLGFFIFRLKNNYFFEF